MTQIDKKIKKINTNPFLSVNKRKIDNLIYQCEEYRASGSYGGRLNLFDIIYTMKSLVQEIETLQDKLDKVENALSSSIQKDQIKQETQKT
jgi:hypothetical protein